jgi:YHS domain-containing protein
LAVGLLLAAFAAPALLAFKPVHTDAKTRLALGGYDAVAYHTEGKAVRGVPYFQTDWKGAVWRFRSRKHLEAFREKPEAYAPVYGGYCATSIAAGEPAGCDPTIFVVRDGRLHVFGSREHRDAWLRDPEAFDRKAATFYRKATASEKDSET